MSTWSYPEWDTRLGHGGRVRAAAARYRIPLSDWLDLSTGINPNGWPVPRLAPGCWSRLPEDDDGLLEVARAYYLTESIVAVAGSQAAIQTLPRLREKSLVGVVFPSYCEHARAWETNGHQVIPVEEDEVDQHVGSLDVLVLVNPSNPSGCEFEEIRLLSWREKLQERGGWLVVDEAFMDMTPERSLAPSCPLPGLIVLRSLGKFFGLAGARVGFVIAQADLLNHLAAVLGPWSVAGPSRDVARLSLSDTPWQRATRIALAAQGERLAALLGDTGLTPNGGTALYQWIQTNKAIDVYEQLARQGVLIRLFDDPKSIRIGLPANEQQWQRLERTLGIVKVSVL